MKNNGKSAIYDCLDTKQQENLRNFIHENWRYNFIIRFYNQMYKKKWTKKDLVKKATSTNDKHSLLPIDYKLSQSTLTECTKYDSRTLRMLNINTLIAISNALDVSIDYLLGIEECENHENTDVYKVTGLSNDAVDILKKDKNAKRQLNAFLIHPQLSKLVTAIENQKYVHMLYQGVSKEFSKSLFSRITSAYTKFNADTFALDRTAGKYMKYLANQLPYMEFEDNGVTEYIQKHTSEDFQYQLRDKIDLDNSDNKKIYNTFLTLIVTYTYELLGNFHNTERAYSNISEAFMSIVKKYIETL